MGQKQEGPGEEEQAGSDLPDPQKRQHHGVQVWTGARAPPQVSFILVKSACLILQGCQAVHCHFSCVRLFATPWTVACQVPLSMGFSRQENWSGLPFPSSGDLSDPGMEPMSPALAGKFFTSESPGKPLVIILVSWLVCLQQIHLNKKRILKAKTFKGMCYLSAEFFTGLSQGNTGESP